MKSILLALVVVLALLWATAEAGGPHDWRAVTTSQSGARQDRLVIRGDSDMTQVLVQNQRPGFAYGIGNEVNYVWAGTTAVNSDPNGATKNPNILREHFWGPTATTDCVWNGFDDAQHPGCYEYVQTRWWIDYPGRDGGVEWWVRRGGQWLPMLELAGSSYIQMNGYGNYAIDFRYLADNTANNWRLNWMYDASMAQMILTRQPFIYFPEAAGCPYSAQLCVKGGDILTDGYVVLGQVAGLPPASDCDATVERGRMKVDSAAGLLYVCMDSGWVAK